MAKRSRDDDELPTARIIDGKAVAADIRGEIREATETLQREHGITPGLAVVLVGNRTDSATYVRMKKKAAVREPGWNASPPLFLCTLRLTLSPHHLLNAPSGRGWLPFNRSEL
jgi:hypothetical protein